MQPLFQTLNFLLLVSLLAGCDRVPGASKEIELTNQQLADARQARVNATPLEKVLADSVDQTTKTVSYDASYVKLDYPNGDVPIEKGVCSDVIIRAFRKGGVDLQKEVHEDMKKNFAKYPRKWGARSADRNIDHRRVPNLMTWFERQGKGLAVSGEARDYQPGDVVSWEMAPGQTHIGLVSGIKVKNTDRYAIIHNIGAGTKLEDVLFQWKIIGHYRYF